MFTEQVIHAYHKSFHYRLISDCIIVFLYELKYMSRKQCQFLDLYAKFLAPDQKEKAIFASYYPISKITSRAWPGEVPKRRPMDVPIWSSI